MIISAPDCARRLAVARPIPLLLPVTNAILPASGNCCSVMLFLSTVTFHPATSLILVLCHYILNWEWLYQILQYGYFLVYLIEDGLPFGRAGHHMMLVATKWEIPMIAG